MPATSSSGRPNWVLPWVLPWTLVALAVLFAAVVRIRLLDTPLERDEGEYAYAGQLLLQGIPPYQLAFNMKFPGTYGSYAVMMAVFGQTASGIRWGFLVVNAATVVMIYLLGKRLFTPAAGVAASAAYALLSLGEGVLGTQAHATHFVVLAVMAGTLLLVRALDTGYRPLLLSSGVCYGVGILMKQHAVLLLLFGSLYLIWDRRALRRTGWAAISKDLVPLVGGAAVPVALTGFALWRAGVFGRFWFWTFTYARQYLLERSLSDGIATFGEFFPRAIGPNLAIWLIALAGLVALWWKKEDRANAIFLTGFLGFSFLAASAGLYFREHYFVLVLPAVSLLAGSAVSWARRRMPAAPWLVYGLYGAALLISIVTQKEFLFDQSPLELSRKLYGYNPFPEAVQIGDYIRSHSEPGSQIAVLGSEPEIPFYAHRHSATGHIYMYGLMESQPYALSMQDELIRDLETSRPEYVIMVKTQASWLRMPNSPQRIFEWWNEYNPRHYKMVGLANIYADLPPNLKWGEVDDYSIKSTSAIMVYKRTDP